MTTQLTLVTDAKNAERQDRLNATFYNALYMLEFQICRVQAGVWDALSAKLLTAGVKTARDIVASSKTYGRYTVLVIRDLIAQADALLAEVEAA
jgi:hypothetical protein